MILATSYFLCQVDDRGNETSLELTGSEHIQTTCPKCSCRHEIDFYNFCKIMQDGDIFGTMIFCDDCAAQKNL